MLSLGHVCRQYDESYIHHVITEQLARAQTDWISEEEKTKLLHSIKHQVHRS